MVTPVAICGAECGVDSGGTGIPTGSLRHLSALGATCTIQSGGGLTAGSWSARSFKFNPSAAVTDTTQVNFPSVSSPATLVYRCYVMFTVLPNAIRTIISTGNGLSGIRYNPTGTKLEAFAGTATTVVAGSFVPTTNVWYRLDVKSVINTTLTTDWRVDGVAQTQASKAGQTAAAQASLTLGHNASGAGGSVSATATYYLDDICVSGTSGDYPIGAGQVSGLFPNADGTHNYNAATDFLKNNTTNVNGTSSLETTTWQSLQNPLTATVGNFMAMAGASTEYLEWAFDNLPVSPLSINGVTIVSSHHSQSTLANTQSLRVEDGATEDAVLALVDYSDTTISFNAKTYAVAPSTSTAWTEAKVNALLARWGYSTDVSPVPFIDGVCFEVDYVAPRALVAKVGTASSAKVSTVNRIRPVVASLATADSAKATILLRSKNIVAKAGTATSAKATLISRNRPLVAKAATAASAKATNLIEAKRLTGKGATASSAKASSLVELKSLVAKAATADSAKALGISGVPRALAAKSGTATSAKARLDLGLAEVAAHVSITAYAKATSINTARPLLAKAATASKAKATLTTQHAGQKAMESKVNTATSAKAVVGKTLPLAGKAPIVSSAKAPRLNRLRPTFAAPSVRVASSAKATTLGFAKGLSAKAAIATSAKGDFDTGNHKHIVAKLRTAASAKASLRVGFLGSGFTVARALATKPSTATSAKADLTLATEGFYVARAMRAKLANATSANATLIVSYFGNGGFLVNRPIRAKAATSDYARATTLSQMIEAFLILRAMRAKSGTATSAKATLSIGLAGPGFVVARAMGGKAATATSAKAALSVGHGALTAKFPTAASAKATTLSRGVGMTVKAAVASSAKASTRTARPLAAKAATAMTFKPAFLDTQHAGQKSLGARLNTASSAKASIEVVRPLSAKAPTASAAHATTHLTAGLAAKAPTATSAWGTMGYGRFLTAAAPTAVSLRAALSTGHGLRVRLATASSAKASLSIKQSTTLGGAEINFDELTAGMDISFGPSRRAGVAVTYR